MIYSNVLQAMGQTPLVQINRLNPYNNVCIAAKLESRNPGGSIKDRVALAMVEAAEKSGELTQGKTIIEATSGNTGIGLAMVCAVKGYRLKLLMSESASEERKRILQAYGAEIALTPAHLATDGAIEEAYRMAREHPEKYVLMDQYNNQACIDAHYQYTAQEIWDQTEGKVSHVVVCLGTSGTIMGICKRLKELNPAIQIIGIEPYAGHKIQGLKNMQESYPPGIYNKKSLDRIIHVEDEEAFANCRELAEKEGIFVGMSGGAAFAGSLRVASELEHGLVVTIFPDSGDRYLSTPLFNTPLEKGLGLWDVSSRSKKYPTCAADQSLGLFTLGPSLDNPLNFEPWRRILILDILKRYLRHKGCQTKMTIGVPDYDDRALQAARDEGLELDKFSSKMLSRLQEYGTALGLSKDVVFEPASGSINQMLKSCRDLLNKGLGYEKLRSVYYDVQRDKSYGILSHVDPEKLSLGKTVDLEDYTKDNPRDFTLLKRASLQDLKEGSVLKTDWGNVRPSWYLQMAGAALHSLHQVDICLAGYEHAFPQLENLRAIWSGQGYSQQTSWILSAPVQGAQFNDFKALLDKSGSMEALRLWFLSVSYRKPLLVSEQNLAMWSNNQHRLQELVYALHLVPEQKSKQEIKEPVQQALFDLKSGFQKCMDNDLSLHHFWPVIFGFCKDLNRILSRGRVTYIGAQECLEQLTIINNILGIINFKALPLLPEQWPQKVSSMIQKRKQARENKEYEWADKLRLEILELGYKVEDGPQGVRLFTT